jgi:hypothetical protein
VFTLSEGGGAAQRKLPDAMRASRRRRGLGSRGHALCGASANLNNKNHLSRLIKHYR